jgi:hypothetical protein
LNCKIELWALFDSQRHGYLRVICRTLYDLRVKKRICEPVYRKHEVSYQEFNNVFGIKKHELDRSQLLMFSAKYLDTLKLFMPTIGINKGDDEDSEYEE